MYENVKRGGVKNIFTCGLWKDLKGASLAAIKKKTCCSQQKGWKWKYLCENWKKFNKKGWKWKYICENWKKFKKVWEN